MLRNLVKMNNLEPEKLFSSSDMGKRKTHENIGVGNSHFVRKGNILVFRVCSKYEHALPCCEDVRVVAKEEVQVLGHLWLCLPVSNHDHDVIWQLIVWKHGYVNICQLYLYMLIPSCMAIISNSRDKSRDWMATIIWFEGFIIKAFMNQ